MTMDDLVDDPTDWPDKDWETIDTLLRCPSCKDLLNIARTVTSCGHTFCSLCLRQALDSQQMAGDKHCPICNCKIKDYNNDTISNGLIDSILLPYKAVREKTIAALKVKTNAAKDPEEIHKQPAKRKRLNENPFALRSSKSDLSSRKTYKETSSEIKDNSDDDDDDDVIIVEVKRTDQSTRKPRNAANASVTTKEQKTNQRQKIPVQWNKAKKESQLKQEMHQYGIPTHGDRKTREARYNLFIQIWNAACESKVPVSNEQIFKQLEEREASLTKHTPTIKTEDDAKKHASAYSSEFEKLVARARLQQQQQQRLNHSNDSYDVQTSGV